MPTLPHPDVPIVAAPMAGGVSTPELVAAVTRAGGFGFLAGGLQPAAGLADEVRRTRDLLGTAPFGVNLMVPGKEPPVDLTAFRRALQPVAERFGVQVPEPVWGVDDDYPAKVEVLVRDPVAVVSFTFGIPDAGVVQRLHAAGSSLLVTVTNQAEAIAAWAAGADGLVVQGPGAGGHRGTHRPGLVPDRTPLPRLVAAVSEVVALPLFAAGGVSTAAQVEEVLAAGATACQVGTLFLRCPEAGTSAVHRQALDWERETVVTRCFSGRWARSLRNVFVDEMDGVGPVAYPQVQQLTAPVRAAAAKQGDAEFVQLWAGTGYREAREVPAAEVVAGLWSRM